MNNTPAFPTSNWQKIAPMSSGYNEGMTLRDYFAAKALQGMFANPDDSHEHYDLSYEDYVKEIARCSYKMADAMLKARGA
jgi:hypothetical protein